MSLAAPKDGSSSLCPSVDVRTSGRPDTWGAWLGRIGHWVLLRPLHWLYCRWQLIRPAWFSALIVALVIFAFLHPQTQDVLLAAAENGFQVAMLFLGLLVFACTAWYCTRAILYVDYKLLEPHMPGPHRWCPAMEPKTGDLWRRRTPRFFGVAAPLCVGGVYLWHAYPFEMFDWNAGLGVASLLLAVALYRFFVVRRQGKEGRFVQLQSKLPRTTFWLLFALLAAVAFFLALIVALPQHWPAAEALPTTLGSPFLFLLAAAFWLALGSLVLVYPTYRFRLAPSLVLIAILVAATFNWLPSRMNDHRVRDFADDPTLTGEFQNWVETGRPDLQGQFVRWLKKRSGALAQADADRRPYPVFILAAEGGGIRAAYWTAAVLAELEDRMPGFACHVFAISGVSGGSVGAAVYAGLIADKVGTGELDCRGSWFRLPDAPQPSPWIDEREKLAKSPLLLSRATLTLRQDFLAPALAGMLYPDLIQRFLPVSALPDRATYLEKAWEAAWTRVPRADRTEEICSGAEPVDDGEGHRLTCNWMSAPFHELWRTGGRATLVPSLFLNATEVETGRRLIVSNLRLPAESDGGAGRSFNETTDAFAPDERLEAEQDGKPQIGAPIRLSTAAGLSARFTYVSPPARLHNGVHVVDGGYYENYGVLSAHDILREIRKVPIESIDPKTGQKRPTMKKLRFIVITLVNSTFEEMAAEEDSADLLARAFHETRAPLATVLGTRTARGKHAVADLNAELPEDLHRIGLRPPGKRLHAYKDPSDNGVTMVRTFPLGWMLAPSTLKEMGLQAKDAVQAAVSTADSWIARYAWRPPASARGDTAAARFMPTSGMGFSVSTRTAPQ